MRFWMVEIQIQDFTFDEISTMSSRQEQILDGPQGVLQAGQEDYFALFWSLELLLAKSPEGWLAKMTMDRSILRMGGFEPAKWP